MIQRTLKCGLNLNACILVQAPESDEDVGTVSVHGNQFQTPPKVTSI